MVEETIRDEKEEVLLFSDIPKINKYYYDEKIALENLNNYMNLKQEYNIYIDFEKFLQYDHFEVKEHILTLSKLSYNYVRQTFERKFIIFKKK